MRRSVALLAIAVMAGIVCVPGVAGAHAAYKDSEPADGETVSSPPSRVTAEFTEPLAGGSYLRITDECGSQVDGEDVSIVGYEMSVPMSGSRSGRYTVFYRAASQLDPHIVEGTFTFTADSGSSCPSTEERSGPSEDPDGAPAAGDDDDTVSSEDPVDLAQVSSGDDRGSGGRQSSGGSGTEASSPRPPGRPPTSARVPNLAGSEGSHEEEPSVYDGLPMGTFGVALVLAALIGAAGGKIYAGIMGPRA